jgi:cytochrome c biogenesis protein CcmG/thiol:disulfide interchange protein DsbE
MWKVICSAAILLICFGCVRRNSEGQPIAANSYLHKKPPELVVEKWLTPKPDTRGKWVLIDFWATWCPPCREAIPELNLLAKKFGDKLVVIGITDEEEADVRKMRTPQIEYFVASDTKGTTKKRIHVELIPHVILIDPQGFVRYEGYPDEKGYELTEKKVEELFAKYSK